MVSISILKYLLLKSGLLTKKLNIKLNIEFLWMKAMWLCVLYKENLKNFAQSFMMEASDILNLHKIVVLTVYDMFSI